MANRRAFFKTLLAVPCGLAAWLAWDRLKPEDPTIRTIGAPVLSPPKPLELADSSGRLSFCALGDTGLDSEFRAAVIERLKAETAAVSPDLMLLVGDNFYEAGVESVEDPKWQRDFQRPFAADVFDMPFYACLGNHDYYGNVAAQSEYSQLDDRWNMPAPYYSFTRQIDADTTAEFFVLDTTPIEEGDHSTRSQIKWLRDKLQRSTADWKIVVGHHPLFTGGEHGPSRLNFRQLVPLFDEFQIDLYICGHDHDLQLHDTGRGWLHLVSGAGSKLRSVRWIKTTMYAEAVSGFARVTLTSDELGIEIFSTEELRFAMQRTRKALVAAA